MTPEEQAEAKARLSTRIRWTRALNEAYHEGTGLYALPQWQHDAILDAFIDRLDECALPRMRAFYALKPFLIDRIRERAGRDVFWRQSALLCAYMWIDANPAGTKRLWPLPPKTLAPLFSDLGIAFRDPV